MRRCDWLGCSKCNPYCNRCCGNLHDPKDKGVCPRCCCLRKICCEKFSDTDAQGDEEIANEDCENGNILTSEEREEVLNWEFSEDRKEGGKSEEIDDALELDDCAGRCGNSDCCSKLKSYIRSDDGGSFRDQMVYLVIILPFNFMISCYTVVGENFVDVESSEEVSGGLWALGSPVAIEMIDMPSIFMSLVLSIIGACALLAFLYSRIKWCRPDNISTAEEMNVIAFLMFLVSSIYLIFLCWLGISMWIFVVAAQNKLSDVTFDIGTLAFGVDLSFSVPDIQIPTAILSITCGAIKLELFLLRIFRNAIINFNCNACTKPKLTTAEAGSEVNLATEAGNAAMNQGVENAEQYAKAHVDREANKSNSKDENNELPKEQDRKPEDETKSLNDELFK